jgi:hypothetical protein
MGWILGTYFQTFRLHFVGVSVPSIQHELTFFKLGDLQVHVRAAEVTQRHALPEVQHKSSSVLKWQM